MASSNVSRRTLPLLASALLLRAQPPRLPFRLQSRQLADVRIALRAATTKPGSGRDEIVITGDGKVTLRTSTYAPSPPQERTGSVPPAALERLLELFALEGIDTWDDAYPAINSHYATKVLSVELRGTLLKQIVMARPEFPAFAHAVGALKLLAAQACPDALNRAFLPRL